MIWQASVADARASGPRTRAAAHGAAACRAAVCGDTADAAAVWVAAPCPNLCLRAGCPSPAARDSPIST